MPYAILLFGFSEYFRRAGIMMGVGVVSSLFIEIMQWLTKTGYFELDDIMTNTLGMLIGYLICVLFVEIYKKNINSIK